MEESFYWTIQNEVNELCHASRVFTWSNGEESWWTIAICFLLMETIYFWMHVYCTRALQDMYTLKLCSFIFTALFILLNLQIFGILPNIISTVCYLIYKVRLAALLVTKTLRLEEEDKMFDTISLNEEVYKCILLQGEAKSKANQRILHLQNRVKMNREEAHIFNYFTSNKGLRDLFFVFGFLYFGITLILEVLWYNSNNISDSVFINSVCKFLIRWSTSPVPVLVVCFCFCYIDRIITGISVWLVSWETAFEDAINTGIDSRIPLFTISTLILESGIPSSNTDLDLKAVIIIAVICYCFVIQKTIDTVGRNIIEICNRSPDLKIWFYLRVCVAFLVLLTIPIAVFAFVFFEEVWLLFFASGSVLIISNIIFIIIEWCLDSLMWHMDQSISTLEQCIHYNQLAKECSYIFLLPLQFYARYMLTVFRAWWILRVGNLIFNYTVLVVVLISVRKNRYDHNRKMLLLLNNLSDISYAPLHGSDQAGYTCSICFSAIRDGKELPCKHVFHAQCLQRWFKVRIVCPTCNLVLT